MRTNRIVLPFILFVACWTEMLVSAESAVSQSTSFQINSAHNGNVSFDTGFSPPLAKMWSRDLGGPISYPLIADGKIIVTVGNSWPHNGSQLYAMDLKSGNILWQKLIGGLYWWSNAAYDNGTVFLANYVGEVQAYDATTGITRWMRRVPKQQFYSFTPPVAANGRLLAIGSYVGVNLYSFAENTGSLLWTDFFSDGGVGVPALTDDSIYVNYPCNQYKLSLTGSLIWLDRGDCRGGGGSTPVYFNGRLYVRDIEGDYILDSNTGAKLGSFKAGPPPAIFTSGGNDYLLTVWNGKLTCTNSANLSVLWTFAGDGQLSSAPLVINGVVVEGSLKGNLYVIDRLTGANLWATRLGAPVSDPGEGSIAHPTTGLGAAEGVLVVSSTNVISAFAPKT